MNKIRLFYVEDEPSLGKIVKESLESRDFEVRMITSGLNAIEEFKLFNPDVCVLDVMLPHKDGFTISKEIKEIPSSVPILFLTAKNQTEDILKGFASGCNDYIHKPFSMEELIVRIKNLLSLTSIRHTISSLSTSVDSMNIGLYIFFPLRQELHFENDVRRLSHRETELLLLLSNSLNQLVTRKEILMKIWGNDSFFNSRNLDVYINKLRDCLRSDSRVELITLKGVGYRLVG
ncbi:MAG: response regulator transcription factor [Saprospiraceae bacterium]|nr:response regulator transcription factor [Saprospiraceae bacterium]MBK8484914.1 response regulator transcription factor [Saprospiraceae bacterium]MBK9727791.1 response regulator transcription factor [Saprospiraceae bacterium]